MSAIPHAACDIAAITTSGMAMASDGDGDGEVLLNAWRAATLWTARSTDGPGLPQISALTRRL